LTLLAVISDIHGNAMAMEQFILKLEKIKPDVIICLGDTIGYLDEEIKCYEILRKLNAIHLMGNHEAMVLGMIEINRNHKEIYKLDEARKRLSAQHLKSIGRYPLEAKWVDGKFRAEFYHGAPTDPLNGRVHLNTDLEPKNSGTNFVFVGNTHRSFSVSKPWGKLVNVGSLGLPRDNGNLGTFMIVDTEKRIISREFITFDVDKIVLKYRSMHPTIREIFYKREPIANMS
jgi:predicted phosphodiesterase